MAVVRSLVVKIAADVSSLQKDMLKAQKTMQKTANNLKTAGTMLTTSVTAPILAVGFSTLKMAMQAVESENLFKESMGKMSDSAKTWSKNLRKQFGLNEYEVRKTVSTFNVMLESMKLGEKNAYDMSKGLTQLGYDMASFYNLKPEEAFMKLQAGITGEIEPLKRLGILINQTTIEAYAFANGIAKKGEKLTEQQKVVARYGAILEQTSKAQGDLGRTLDSPTNKFRIMGAKVQNLAIDFGVALLPALDTLLIIGKTVLAWAEKAVNWFANLNSTVKTVIVVIAGLAAALGPVLLIGGQVVAAIAAIVGVIGGVSAPVLGVVAAIGVLVSAFATFYATNEKLRAVVGKAWEKVLEVWEKFKLGAIIIFKKIKDVIAGAFDFIEDVLNDNKKNILSIWKSLKDSATNIFNTIQYVVGSFVNKVLDYWNKHETEILRTWNNIKNAAATIFKKIIEVVAIALPVILEYVEKYVSNIAVAWEKYGGSILVVVGYVFKTIMLVVENAMKEVASVTKIMMSVVAGDWKGAWNNIQEMTKDKIQNVKNHINTAKNFGYEFAKEIKDGINKEAPNVKQASSSMGKGIHDGISDWRNLIKLKTDDVGKGMTSSFNDTAIKMIDTADMMSSGVGNSVKKVKEKIEDFTQKMKESFSVSIDIVKNKLELMVAKMGDTADSGKIMQARLQALTEEYDLQKQKVDMLNNAYSNMSLTKGATAIETRKLYNEFLEESIAVEKLRQEIDKTSASMNGIVPGGVMVNGVKHSSDGMKGLVKRRIETKENNDEIVKIAKKNNVDMSVAYDMMKTNQSLGIKKYAVGTNYHTGGNALVGEKGPEIMAMPKGASVTPTNKLNSFGQKVINIYITGNSISNEIDIDKIGQKLVNKLRTAGVAM